MRTARPETRLGIQSVDTAGVILKVMAEAGRPLRLKELAALSGMPPGKAHRYLISLSRIGLAEQDPVSGHYGLGAMAITVGLAALRSVDVVKSASEVLPGLRDEVGETTFLAFWGNTGPVMCRIEESGRRVYVNIRVGSVLPVLPSAAGRVFAAFLPAAKTRQLIEAELSEPSASSAGATYTRERVDEILTQVRAQGLASTVGELVPGISVLAAPVFNHGGNIAAVIGVFGLQQDVDVRLDGLVAGALKRAAATVAKRLGFSFNA